MGVKFNGTESEKVIQVSSDWMGTPYSYGGLTKSGVDCSGFVYNVYKEAYGVTLQRNSAAMAKQVKRVSKDDMQCGDLVFFTIKDKRVSHVGIYMGDNRFVHASSSNGVSMADLGDAYWSKYFSGAGRVIVIVQQPQSGVVINDNVLTESRSDNGKKTSALPNKKAATKKKSAADKVLKDTKKPTSKSDGDDVIVVFDEEF